MLTKAGMHIIMHAYDHDHDHDLGPAQRAVNGRGDDNGHGFPMPKHGRGRRRRSGACTKHPGAACRAYDPPAHTLPRARVLMSYRASEMTYIPG